MSSARPNSFRIILWSVLTLGAITAAVIAFKVIATGAFIENACACENNDLRLYGKPKGGKCYFDVLEVGEDQANYAGSPHVRIRIDGKHVLDLRNLDMVALKEIAPDEGPSLDYGSWPAGMKRYHRGRSWFYVNADSLLCAILYPEEWSSFEFALGEGDWMSLPQSFTDAEAESRCGCAVSKFFMH